jgi:hypothetical protein
MATAMEQIGHPPRGVSHVGKLAEAPGTKCHIMNGGRTGDFWANRRACFSIDKEKYE